MEQFHFLNFFVYLFSTIHTVSSLSGKQIWSRKLSGTVIHTDYKMSFNQCKQQCDKMVDCMSANFVRTLSFCELMSDLAKEETLLDFAPGYIFYEKPNSADVCSSSKCQTGSSCRQDGGCEVEHCAHALQVDNGIVFGNMSYIGAKRVIECLPNYKLVLGDNVTTCTESGRWGDTLAILCEMVCPLPAMTLDGGFVAYSNIQTVSGVQTFSGNGLFEQSSIDILDSSTVEYKCDSNRKMVGPGTITCQSRIWSSYPSCVFTFRSSCSNNNDCTEQGLVCLDATCLCNGVQIYTNSGHKCVDRCPNGPANTFQTKTDVTVVTLNLETFFYTGFIECRDKCLHNSNCKGFLHSAWTCFLYWSYGVDVYIEWGVGHYHRRDCA